MLSPSRSSPASPISPKREGSPKPLDIDSSLALVPSFVRDLRMDSFSLRHNKSATLIPSDPDRKQTEERNAKISMEKVAQWIGIIVGPLEQEIMSADKNEAASATRAIDMPSLSSLLPLIHELNGLNKKSTEKRFYHVMVATDEFISALARLLSLQFDQELYASLLRCYEHAAQILNNLSSNTSDKTLFYRLYNNKTFVNSLPWALTNRNVAIKEQISLIILNISKRKECRSSVCLADRFLSSIVSNLYASASCRLHLVNALLFLAGDTNNRFIIPRQPGMLDELALCFERLDEHEDQRSPDPYASSLEMHEKCIELLHLLMQIRENIPLVARNTVLCENLDASWEASVMSDTQNAYPTPAEDEKHKRKLEHDKRLRSILRLIELYNTRLSSNDILYHSGFNAPTIEVDGTNVSSVSKKI